VVNTGYNPTECPVGITQVMAFILSPWLPKTGNVIWAKYSTSFIAGVKSSINSKIDDYIDEHDLDIPKYNRNNHFFQPNYHDHIIRNHVEYKKIQKYIINNPLNWDGDKFNP